MAEPVVSTAQGRLLGRIIKNIHNCEFYSFQGIPYAKPPINELRFKAPQPPEPWQGIRDATKEGNECYSRHMLFKNIIGSEDCLFLNVYTKCISTENNASLKPVMVWIHGGGFRHGSSKTDVYGPEYLLTEDIVLVTINYRLGVLGFLSFEEPSLDVCKNAGLKDMIMALKWVQENIKHFCGDPNNVTIFGESAGAAAVHYLVLSPLSKGLFHKAIAQSGCALNTFARGKNTLSTYFAQILQLPEADDNKILEYLKSLPVEKLFEISEKVVNMCDIYNNYGKERPFCPVIEKPSKEAFLNNDPMQIINSGNYNQVPMIFGYNTREGMLVEMMIKPTKPRMPQNFEKLIPFMLNIEHESNTSQAIAEKMKQFYYPNEGLEENLENFYLFHTDNYFVREILCATRHHANTATFPVYLYRMSVDTKLNLFKNFSNIQTPGVAHGDDLGYLFKTKISPELQSTSLEELSMQRFIKYWTNFAKHGNPNSSNDGDLLINWQCFTKEQHNFIDIGEELRAEVNPEQERMKFWSEIFSIRPEFAN